MVAGEGKLGERKQLLQRCSAGLGGGGVCVILGWAQDSGLLLELTERNPPEGTE